MFIVLEGLDNAGKTGLADNLAGWLEGRYNKKVVRVREPGGTPIAENIRDLLAFGESKYNEPLTEKTRLLLLNASRMQLVNGVILPALSRGEIVLSDRFYWSTFAYTLDHTLGFAKQLHTDLFGKLHPDVTFWLDVSLEDSQARCGTRPLDDVEKKMYQRFNKVRTMYQQLCTDDPNAVKIDTAIGKDQVYGMVTSYLNRVYPK